MYFASVNSYVTTIRNTLYCWTSEHNCAVVVLTMAAPFDNLYQLLHEETNRITRALGQGLVQFLHLNLCCGLDLSRLAVLSFC